MPKSAFKTKRKDTTLRNIAQRGVRRMQRVMTPEAHQKVTRKPAGGY